MVVAKFYVSGTCAQVIAKETITSGMVGTAKIEVIYEAGLWGDLTRTVVFRSTVTKDVITSERYVEIPPEVLVPGARLWVGFYGTGAGKALPTVWANLGTVVDGTDPSGDTSTDPTPPVWAQVLEKTEDLEKRMEQNYQPRGDYLESSQLQPAIETALTQAKESGEFDGENGEDGGYYTPSVTQPEAEKIQIDFTPNRSDMPAVQPVTVDLPMLDSGGNADYGAENAGKLLYVGVDGKATVLTLGAGLAIVNGVLTITSQQVIAAICGESTICGNTICGGT